MSNSPIQQFTSEEFAEVVGERYGAMFVHTSVAFDKTAFNNEDYQIKHVDELGRPFFTYRFPSEVALCVIINYQAPLRELREKLFWLERHGLKGAKSDE